MGSVSEQSWDVKEQGLDNDESAIMKRVDEEVKLFGRVRLLRFSKVYG